MFGDFLGNAAGYRIETYFGIALIVVAEVDAAVVWSPLGVLDIAIEFVRERVCIAAIAIHEVELGGLMALVAVIVAGVGDEFSVGRHGGRIVRPFAIRERAKRAIGHAELIDFIVEIFVIGFGMAVDGDDQILAIRRPGGARGAEFVATIGEISVGDLTRSAAFAVNDKNLHEAGLEITRTVEAIDQAIVGGGRVSPFCAGRGSGQIGDVRAFAQNE